MILQISFPEEIVQSLGLQPDKPLRNLSKFVVLAGPNGAGKTRYLKLLEKVIQDRNSISKDYSEWLRGFPIFSELLKLETKEQVQEWLGKQIPLVEVLAAVGINPVGEIWEKRALLDNVKLTSSPAKVIMLRYELAQPSRPADISPSELDRVVEANMKGGVVPASQSMHAYCDELARALYAAEHPASKGNAEVETRKQEAIEFNRLLRSLLGIEIAPGVNAKSRVFAQVRGRPFNPAELSDGEKILVVWAIMLHRQHQWLEQSILLIDEPENHLHPDVCIRAIEALQRDVLGEHGQIFLATHSVALIAHAGMDSIYFVDEGRIEFAGRKLDALIERLLGGPQGRERLQTFLGDAEQRNFYTFAAQCLLPPGVAEAREGDEQQAQFLRLMSARQKEGKMLRLLDYGAGKGRLALSLAEVLQERSGTHKTIEYFAFNDRHMCDPKDAEACRAALTTLHPGAEAAHYFDRFEAIHVGPSPKMDVVLMCNVLHEVPVSEWPRLFHRLADILSEEGSLLIMEDSLPPIGELPDPTGYLLLDQISAQALFHTTDGVRMADQAKGERLIALEVSQRVLKQVNREHVEGALRKIRENAFEEIKHLRSRGSEVSSYDRGRLHAHYTMLYTNASLALGM